MNRPIVSSVPGQISIPSVHSNTVSGRCVVCRTRHFSVQCSEPRQSVSLRKYSSLASNSTIVCPSIICAAAMPSPRAPSVNTPPCQRANNPVALHSSGAASPSSSSHIPCRTAGICSAHSASPARNSRSTLLQNAAAPSADFFLLPLQIGRFRPGCRGMHPGFPDDSSLCTKIRSVASIYLHSATKQQTPERIQHFRCLVDSCARFQTARNFAQILPVTVCADRHRDQIGAFRRLPDPHDVLTVLERAVTQQQNAAPRRQFPTELLQRICLCTAATTLLFPASLMLPERSATMMILSSIAALPYSRSEFLCQIIRHKLHFRLRNLLADCCRSCCSGHCDDVGVSGADTLRD